MNFLKTFLDYLIETVNEMELMKTGDQRCTDFLLEAMTFHLMTSEQKAKHCRNVSYRRCPNRPTVLNLISEYSYEAENTDRITKNSGNRWWSGAKSNKESGSF